MQLMSEIKMKAKAKTTVTNVESQEFKSFKLLASKLFTTPKKDIKEVSKESNSNKKDEKKA